MDVTVGNADTNAVIAFTPTEAGTYTLTVEGDALAVANAAQSAPDEFMTSAPADSAYSKNATADFIAHKMAVKSGMTIYFTVTAKNVPATFKVNIKQTAGSKDTFTDAKVDETLTQYTKPADKALYGVPMDGTAQLIYNQTDKLYHLGTANGPVVVVKIKGSIDSDRLENEGELAYLELVTQGSAKYEAVTSEEGAESMTVVDYKMFLRGFTDYNYDDKGNAIVPTDIETEIYYAKFVNEDGVYPLTEELKLFLERFYSVNKSIIDWNVPMDTQVGSRWMFPCYYYDDIKEEGEADAIVGEYEFVSNNEYEVGGPKSVWDDEKQDYVTGTVTKDDYKLVVDKNNKFTIYELTNEGYDEVDSGSWSNTDGVYTFTIPDLWGGEPIVYTVTFNSETGELHLVGSDETEWKFVLKAQA